MKAKLNTNRETWLHRDEKQLQRHRGDTTTKTHKKLAQKAQKTAFRCKIATNKFKKTSERYKILSCRSNTNKYKISSRKDKTVANRWKTTTNECEIISKGHKTNMKRQNNFMEIQNDSKETNNNWKNYKDLNTAVKSFVVYLVSLSGWMSCFKGGERPLLWCWRTVGT